MENKQQQSKQLVVVEDSAANSNEGSAVSLLSILDHIEQLLMSTEQGAMLHAKIADYLEQVKPLLNNPDVKIPEKGKEILNKANDFVNKRPLTTLGIAAGAGILFALWASRGKK